MLGIVGKEAERAVSVLLYVLLKRKQCKKGPMCCVRECVWIYSGFIATCYFHGSTSVNGVSVPPRGASGFRILPPAHKPGKLHC